MNLIFVYSKNGEQGKDLSYIYENLCGKFNIFRYNPFQKRINFYDFPTKPNLTFSSFQRFI